MTGTRRGQLRGSVVMVTGVSGDLGSLLAVVLGADPRVARVIGVDTSAPPVGEAAPPGAEALSRAGGAAYGFDYVRADIRNPLIGKVIETARVDTVVHLSMSSTTFGHRVAAKENNVLGAMQLLAACQSAPSLRRLVVKSTTAVYGASHRDPSMFTEEADPPSHPASGYARDASEIEEYVRGFARRRPDVTVSVLRLSNIVGPRIETPLTRYLCSPVVPTVLGYDPRIQLVHADDVIGALHRAAVHDLPGPVNVAGDGVLALSQAIRRAGRLGVPVPGPGIAAVAWGLRTTGRLDLSPEQARFLNFGRVVDTTRLREAFGFQPAYTTAAAYDELIAAHSLLPLPDSVLARKTMRPVGAALRAVGASLGVGRG